MLRVAGGDDARERGQWRSDNIHSAHQFIRAAIGVHLIYNHWQHLERLRQRTLCQREAALDIVEIKAVRFALAFYLVDQLLPHVIFGNFVGRSDDQVSLAAGGHQPRLITSVTIGYREVFDGHAGHQETFENAVLNHIHALRRCAFVIERIGAGEFHTADFLNRRVVGNTQEFWQHFLPDFLREGLALFFIFLAMAFQAVAQHFVKENCGGAAT